MVRRSFWVISLIVVLALAGMGVAYGLWYENLYITGTVTTGVVDVELTATWEDVEEKDVGTCDVEVDGDENLVSIVVDNAYPSYECWVTLAVANVGTVPVHLTPLEWWEDGLGDGEAFEDIVAFDDDCFDEIQIHPDEEETCRFLIHFENDDELEMGATYTFAYQFMAHQYNEEPDNNTSVSSIGASDN